MMELLKRFWHWLRPLLALIIGEERLDKFLLRLGFYKVKSRLLLKRGEFPDGIVLWYRAPDLHAINEVCIERVYDRAHIRPGDVVLDVGAHIGIFTVYASKKVGESGKVFSFEPEPENLRILKKNVAINGCSNVQVFPFALSNEEGNIKLFVQELPGRHSIMGGSPVDIQVPVRKLDDVVYELALSRVNVLKIDAEGAESKILSGAKKTLAISNNVILEVHMKYVTLDSITRILSESGFQCEILYDDPYAAILYCRSTGLKG